jgi:cytochrome c peroxidase
MAQAGPFPCPATPGNVICSGYAEAGGGVAGVFFPFEPEVPFQSLKRLPIWNELEQLLDNPYATLAGASCTDAGGPIPGNNTGSGEIYPTYCTNNSFLRRGQELGLGPAPFGVTLPRLLTHPLNYNPSMLAEMRLINRNYPGGPFDISSICYQSPGTPTGTQPPLLPLCGGAGNNQVPVNMTTISPGPARLLPGESAIDNNATFRSQTRRGPGVVCVANPEPVPLGSANVGVCGGDPGEPGYLGFGFPNPSGYSTPAVPFVTNPSTPIPGFARLFDVVRLTPPDGLVGFIPPRNALGQYGLRKPSIRVAQAGGTPPNPNYLWNSGLQLAARGTSPADPTGATNLAPSNENDYVRNRLEAMRLGKALFWDMQVGSDGVQSCGSCHFHAGADNRTKNQVNPNHIGGDVTFQIPFAGPGANKELTAADFPLHRLGNPEISGDPACSPAITISASYLATLNTVLENPKTQTVVCDASNTNRSTNDVASSMGVFFGKFTDIPAIGAMTPVVPGNPVASVRPDLRSTIPADNTDPIPGFSGTCDPATSPTPCPAESLLPTDPNAGHQFRRVEPRNTPTFFLVATNFDNFWDGRARHDFNGGSVFGPSDPQSHVFVDQAGTPSSGTLIPTRQIIRFVSVASLATGPGLSEFEMSRLGRNWAKVGKKLLQAGTTPLANQLVATDDSILGPYSNQGGSACAALPLADRSPGIPAAGKPGLCISYPGLIQRAFYPALWRNTSWHLSGCYTDGRSDIHPNQCATGSVGIPVLSGGAVVNGSADPFDSYVLTASSGQAAAGNTDQFTQMEGNFSLFWGLSIHLWATILVPDDTPFDQFLDANPDAHMAIGEAGEILLTPDLVNCAPGAPARACFRELGNFRRDPGVKACTQIATLNGVPVEPRTCTPGALVAAGGTRPSGGPDPLLGVDLFVGSNLSLKNPNFRSARCGECHAMPTLTDHTMPFTMKAQLPDLISEFIGVPTVERIAEPLGRSRVISGFLLEDEINSNGQDGVERRLANQSIVPHDGSIYPALIGMSFPDGLSNPTKGYAGAGGAIFDNGVYNLGVTPCVADQSQVTGRCDDNGRGNTDAFGWPLSLATLMLKNLGGPGQEPGVPVPTFDPAACVDPANPLYDPSEDSCIENPATGIRTNYTGGLWDLSAQDQQINRGTEGDDVINPQLPPYLYPWANAIGVGDLHPVQDEAGGPPNGMVNTLQNVANNEGFTPSPFIPASLIVETTNGADSPLLGTWPMVNRIGRFGSFKAAQLREVSLTGPYFHNGGKLTLRQVVDFYTRGGDFPVTNAAHRDFNIINLNLDVEANLSDPEKAALVDFLLELTDARVRYARAPFDHPEVFVPLDGTAPENTFGRAGFLARTVPTPTDALHPSRLCDGLPGSTGACFRQVKVVGATGRPLLFNPADPDNTGALPNFLGICDRPGQNFDGTPCTSPISHHSH